LPEKDYSFNEQLALEFVKSQYGAPVLGVLLVLISTIGTGALLVLLGFDKFLALLTPDEAGIINNLTDAQKLALILLPNAPFLVLPTLALDTAAGKSLAKKVLDLNLGNQFWALVT
jgi:hypothetical protein